MLTWTQPTAKKKLMLMMTRFTFPIGTFAFSSNALAREIPSRFFRVIGSVTSVCVFLLWLLVAAATLRDLITGGKKLFKEPETGEVAKEHEEHLEDVGDKNA